MTNQNKRKVVLELTEDELDLIKTGLVFYIDYEPSKTTIKHVKSLAHRLRDKRFNLT